MQIYLHIQMFLVTNALFPSPNVLFGFFRAVRTALFCEDFFWFCDCWYCCCCCCDNRNTVIVNVVVAVVVTIGTRLLLLLLLLLLWQNEHRFKSHRIYRTIMQKKLDWMKQTPRTLLRPLTMLLLHSMPLLVVHLSVTLFTNMIGTPYHCHQVPLVTIDHTAI